MATKENKTINTTATVDDGREEIFIPRGDPKGDPNLFVSVNDYTALLPRGQVSRVPHCAAAEIRRAFDAEAAFLRSSQEREIRETARP